jgi:hypothetical protein
MRLSDHPEPELPETDLAALAAELRAASRRLSRRQILDLADLLHEVIRERQAEERSWRRLQSRYEQAEAH